MTPRTIIIIEKLYLKYNLDNEKINQNLLNIYDINTLL